MSGQEKGKKRGRSKAFYRQSAYGGKRQKTEGNRLVPGIQGYLIMCNSNESSAVRESYNILNEYADQMYGQGKSKLSDETTNAATAVVTQAQDSEEEDEDDIEKALKKEIATIKEVPSEKQRFQNCITKAKNCVFIRSTVEDVVKVGHTIMTDLAEKHVQRARYAARMLPVVGTCKAHTPDIKQLALNSLAKFFSPNSPAVPKSFTVVFKSRNNNGTTCGKLTVIPAVVDAVKEINPSVTFSWNDYDIAILVEIVCTVCCLCVAPDYVRFRKYNLQELKQGVRDSSVSEEKSVSQHNTGDTSGEKCDQKEGDQVLTSVSTALVQSDPSEKINNDDMINKDQKGTDKIRQECDGVNDLPKKDQLQQCVQSDNEHVDQIKSEELSNGNNNAQENVQNEKKNM